MNKQRAKIRDWIIVCMDPVLGEYVLMGKIFDHPRQTEFNDPNGQMTSLLVKVDFKDRFAETLNTIYELVGKEQTYAH